MTTAIKVENVSKSFGAVKVLDAVTFSAGPGVVLGLLGRNGAGKSTLINLIVGHTSPTDGRISVFDDSPPLAPRTRARLGLAPQRLALYNNLTVRENLTLFAVLEGLRGEDLVAACARCRDLLKLAPFMDRRVSRCSEGMKRRANVAAALLGDPDLVLLDEPTASVDVQSRADILDAARAIADLGKTVLYTTHYIEEAEKICDTIAILEQGRLKAFAPRAELMSRFAQTSRVTFRVPPDKETRVITTDTPAVTVGEILQTYPSLRDLSVQPSSLEDVFSRLTRGEPTHV